MGSMLLPVVVFSLAAAADLSKLDWLAGCFAMETPRGVKIVEHWTRPEGGLMLGVNRTVRGDKAVAFEFLRIQVDGDALVYTAMPNGKNETPFRSTSQTDAEVVFENPAHDFPKRILYRKSADGVFARVDGGDAAPGKKQEFALKSVPCH